MGLDCTALIVELRTIVTGQRGGQDLALRALAARTLELAELVQEQGAKIEELTQRLEMRSR
jgi:hypothetical protein